MEEDLIWTPRACPVLRMQVVGGLLPRRASSSPGQKAGDLLDREAAMLEAATRSPVSQDGGGQMVRPVTQDGGGQMIIIRALSVPAVGHDCGPVILRFDGIIRYAMPYLVTVVLIMMGNVKMLVSDGQWILMAHVEFEITSDDGGEFGIGRAHV